MKKRAYAILKNGRVHIQAYAGGKDAGGIAYGPVFSCALTDEDQIVRNLKQAFEYAIQGILTSDREGWKAVQRPMLEATGAKTWSEMAREAKALGFGLHDGILAIDPSSDDQNQGGVDMPEITVPFDAPNLRKVILRAFEISS